VHQERGSTDLKLKRTQQQGKGDAQEKKDQCYKWVQRGQLQVFLAMEPPLKRKIIMTKIRKSWNGGEDNWEQTTLNWRRYDSWKESIRNQRCVNSWEGSGKEIPLHVHTEVTQQPHERVGQKKKSVERKCLRLPAKHMVHHGRRILCREKECWKVKQSPLSQQIWGKKDQSLQKKNN